MEIQKDKIGEVFCQVIEQMAFMFGEETDAESIDTPEGSIIQARMGFSGTPSGELAIDVPEEIAPLIAENLLGIDAEDEEAQQKGRDALKEILNVTCGNILTTLFGEGPIFELTVPEIIEIDEQTWTADLEAQETVKVIVEDIPCILKLSVNEETK